MGKHLHIWVFFERIAVGLGSGAFFFFRNDLQLSPFYSQQYVWKELPLLTIPHPEAFLQISLCFPVLSLLAKKKRGVCSPLLAANVYWHIYHHQSLFAQGGRGTVEVLLTQIYNQSWLSKLVLKFLLCFYWSALLAVAVLQCVCECMKTTFWSFFYTRCTRVIKHLSLETLKVSVL